MCYTLKHILDSNIHRSINKCFVYLAIWPFQRWNEMREKTIRFDVPSCHNILISSPNYLHELLELSEQVLRNSQPKTKQDLLYEKSKHNRQLTKHNIIYLLNTITHTMMRSFNIFFKCSVTQRKREWKGFSRRFTYYIVLLYF